MASDWRCEKVYPQVAIVKILPRISAEQLFSRKKCYLGISLDNPLFKGESLRVMVAWAAEQFERCLVVLGDYLSRFNERILSGCSEKEAGERANKLGDSFLSATADIFSHLPPEKVQLTRWKEHLQSGQFSRSKEMLDVIFESDGRFRAAIEHDALGFVRRMNRRNKSPAVGTEQAVRLSCEYILEEIAVFSSLSECGWTVELYPGSELRVLAQVAKGMYPRAPKGLLDRVSVELKIERPGIR